MAGVSTLGADPLTVIAQLRADGLSFSAIAAILNRGGWPKPRGGRWYGASVHRMVHGVTPADTALHRCTDRCRLHDAACNTQVPIS